MESTNQKISLENTNVSLYIKREDLLHPYVSGNKFRKLKYNLVQAKSENKKTGCPDIITTSINAWHLTKIVSKNLLDEFVFSVRCHIQCLIWQT